MLISQIVPSIRAIISNFDTYVDNVSAWLDKLLENNPDLKNYIVPQVSKASTELENGWKIPQHFLLNPVKS